MGGEWNLSFVNDKAPLDLNAYHQKLRELKAKYSAEAVEGAMWFDEHPEDNIFAKFVYECKRHAHWGEEGHKPVWHLFWDPVNVLISSGRPYHCSDVHARCAPFGFKIYSNKIQKELVRAFPNNFDLYWGDGISGVD